MKDLKKQGLSETEIKRVNQSLKEFGKQLALKPKELAKFESAVDEATDAQLKLAKASKSVNENLYKVYRSLGNSETQAQKLRKWLCRRYYQNF
jgi:septal ring factor EnvC (AmiA/AmiB activator)